MLHLTKVAVGCADISEIGRHQAAQGGAALTRFMPKRAEELIGGSIFWIIKHRLVARQTILSFAMADTAWGPKCRIGLVPGPVPVQPQPRRAHQGWRYLDPADAPPDLDGAGSGDDLPVFMVRELQALWLI
ncbi:DUF1489 family protein [Polymorphobacter sp.]|uniref:DUF1489 family protein n=1 Tax=Polymorphobacter sp. TaxID=1909290 RepID=UPI003F6F4937